MKLYFIHMSVLFHFLYKESYFDFGPKALLLRAEKSLPLTRKGGKSSAAS